MRLCPKCGSLAYFDSYFNSFMCNTCEKRWKETGKIESIKAKNGLIIKRRLTVSEEKRVQYAK
ncbi:MAG: hypothetical protein M0T74_09630 [Desulfitobacterium hafniense]|nr:hypothetical protein [Desulfitobacterium hafniense]